MSLLGELTYALISDRQRTIDVIIPDVVIEEQHHDELIITEFPVEDGAAITDHAYKRPAALAMRCGFSDSTAATVGYAEAVYAEMLALQNSRRPFSVTTGKRMYNDMLISSLDTVTDQHSEHSLMVVVGLREVRITSTQTAGDAQPGTAKAASDPANQAAPQATAGEIDRGAVQAIPYTSSPGFSPGSNTEFSGATGSSPLGPSGASAGFDTITFDGVTYDVPGGDGVVTTAPGSIGGNAGMFGNYGPDAFANRNFEFS